MEENKLLKTWELAALLALCVTLCLGLWAQGRQEAAASRLLRLRVVAASDAPEEQAVKLRVRDAVLACAAPMLDGVGSAAEAEAVLSAEVDSIRAAASAAGEGRNWWCIVFPPVCLAAVEKEQLRPVMQPEDYDLLTREEGWELRFRCVELWGELLNALEGGG